MLPGTNMLYPEVWVHYQYELVGFSVNDNHITLDKNGRQLWMYLEPELARLLDESMVGKTISIIHTDLPDKTYLVRVIEDDTDDLDNMSQPSPGMEA